MSCHGIHFILNFSFCQPSNAEKYHSVDIWIDTRAPPIENLITWLKVRLGDEKWNKNKRYIAFDAVDNEEYFRNLSKLLEDYGVKVFDMLDPNKPTDAPVLVYEEKTAYTVTKAQNMVQKQLVSKENIATLTDTLEGYNNSNSLGIYSICSAKIYMDEIFDIKEKLKQGMTPAEIQQELDERWDYPGIDKTTTDRSLPKAV